MHEPKTHFEQIPVETVKKIATNLPAKEFPEDDTVGDNPVNAKTQNESTSPQERWHEVAQKVQQEEDPQKMIGLVQELIAAFDDEQLHKRLARNQDTPKPSGDSGQGQS